jgi:hypothetical protein
MRYWISINLDGYSRVTDLSIFDSITCEKFYGDQKIKDLKYMFGSIEHATSTLNLIKKSGFYLNFDNQELFDHILNLEYYKIRRKTLSSTFKILNFIEFGLLEHLI